MSGSIGGSRIPTKKVRPTVDKYIEKVLKGFNGYKSCDTTGSYNVIMKLGQEKKEGHLRRDRKERIIRILQH